MCRSNVRVWSLAVLAAIAVLSLSVEAYGQGGGRGRKMEKPAAGMGQMGAGGMPGMGDGAMTARRQLMMNMPMDPLDPAVVLAMKDQLGLTPQQVMTLQKILLNARQQCAAVLKPEQKQQLQATLAGAEMGKPDQPPGQFGGKQKKGMPNGAGPKGNPQADANN